MRTANNRDRTAKWGRIMALALAAGGAGASATPALAGDRFGDRDRDRDYRPRWEERRDDHRDTRRRDTHIGVDIDFNLGRTRVYDRRPVEPCYEERQVRVWVEPVYRTVCDRVWVEPVYKTGCDRGGHEPSGTGLRRPLRVADGAGEGGRGRVPGRDADRLPVLVRPADVRRDAVEVERPQPLVQVVAQAPHLAHRGILPRLLRRAGAGDDGGDRFEVEAPPQGHLGHRHPRRRQRLERVGQLHSLFKPQAREGLADVEPLTVAVVRAMVVGGEVGLARHLSAQ